MRKRALLLAAVFIASLSMTVQETLAYVSVSAEALPWVNTASLKGAIEETYTPEAGVMPGSRVDKTVNVKNTGDVDSLVRVKLEKAWGDSRNADGSLQVNPDLPVDNIEVFCNTTSWLYDAADGYYYYKDVLKPGNTTKEPLLEEFRITEETGNRYRNKTADILVKLECVQAGGNGVTVWGKSLEELGITYTGKPESGGAAEVALKGSEGFAITPSDTDLFLNFKNLAPGESRFQSLKVSNRSGKDAEIFLRAEEAEQEAGTEETAKLIERLLKEYVYITVREREKTVYHGPVWGNLDSGEESPGSMKGNISIGTYRGNEEKEITISLSVVPEMDNRYQELLGKVKWIFTAEWSSGGNGETGGGSSGGTGPRPVNPANPVNPPDTISPPLPEEAVTTEYQPLSLPKTGDMGRMGWYSMMTMLSGIGLLLTLTSKKKKKL